MSNMTQPAPDNTAALEALVGYTVRVFHRYGSETGELRSSHKGDGKGGICACYYSLGNLRFQPKDVKQMEANQIILN